ncbi:MAG TPA: asparagine synthase (glutamine-hydrolyzing) [Opitutaceae bacterium]|nr:asparagine synthase (glutamine-hydrolyzing) [Opitutaceae bacterium]
MCGIAGFVDPATASGAREEAVLRMCSAMVHRGPDDSGIASRGPATIGMRRLSIFDPANGHQPMATPDGRHTLVFNGAIYNFRSLQGELESAGWAFRTRCDTEVLLAALAQWGEGALGRLRGMYAFALWDSADESLFAARDPFGIKPLYFSREGGRLVFASEVAALLASGAVAAEIDPVSVADYLAWFAVPAPRTIYRGVLSLQPGECLRFRRGRLETREAWTFRSIPADLAPCASRGEFVRGLRARLDDAIRAHMIADVPVGAFLSGGLDSAAIAGLMSRATGGALRTFSIGFQERDFSEAEEAEASARHFGAVHHTRIVTGAEVARDLGKFISSCDQPTGDGVNTYYASQAAQAGGVKVALSGLGGDELFGGYPSFRTLPMLARRLPIWRRLPAPLRSILAGCLGIGGTRARKLSDILRSARDPHEIAALQRRVFPEGRRRSMLAPDVLAQVQGPAPFHPRLADLRADVGAQDLFSLASAWEMRTYMADVLLRDSDVMSMRHSLELRVPFIDRPLVEWIWRQPARFRDDRLSPKAALAEAVADVLPPGLASRRKRGFTLPFPVWMRKELRPFLEETFASASIARSGLFSAGPIQALWRGFVSGGDDREWSRVWSLAVLIAFVNKKRADGPSQGPSTP